MSLCWGGATLARGPVSRRLLVGATAAAALALAVQTHDQLAAFLEGTLTRLRQVPGVTAAAVGNNVPVERGLNLAIEPPSGALVDQVRAIDWRYVTTEYFTLFGIPIRAGRAFDERDRATSAPVAVVNEAFVRSYFGTTPMIGRFVQVARGLQDPPREIVGVVGTGSWMVSAAKGDQQFDAVYVPFTTIHTLLDINAISDITLTTVAAGDVTRVMKDVTTLLRGLADKRLLEL